MIFYSNETYVGLVVASLPAILSAYLFIIKDKQKPALLLLMLSAFLLRILMISLDPYLHEWDERFHALVAKNIMDDPFTPMLFKKHIMAFNLNDWAYGHIFVHKQPLFLWQMAISMKLFGINTFALRLPSAITGCILVWLTYDISRNWIKNETIAYIAAFLTTFAYYALELTSGWISLDHNDFAFLFYMTCSFWAFSKYVNSELKLNWALLIGLFAGMAILNKWLVGLLIFGGWVLYLILSEYRNKLVKYYHIGLSLLVTGIVAIPWQIYILNKFPIESAIAFEYNRKHMSEDLSHPGGVLFHVHFLSTAYHSILILFLLIGLITIFFSKLTNKILTISFISMVLVIFSFFSFFVATKMPAFVYYVSSLIIILMSYGIYFICTSCFNYLKLIPKHQNEILLLVTLLMGFYSLKPSLIANQRSVENVARNNKIYNSTVFENMPFKEINDNVILNCRPYENIELMFYQNVIAYHWYPTEEVLDSLQTAGYKFAAFNYTNDQQQLPDYIVNDHEVLILPESLK